MKLTSLPAEIICEIANYLDIIDTKSLGNALSLKMPDYLFISKYKKIYNKSVDEINQIVYTEGIFTSSRRCKNYNQCTLTNYKIKYDYCNTGNIQYLTITRVGESYGWGDVSYAGAFNRRESTSRQVNIFVYNGRAGKQGNLLTHYHEIRH
jgi:hypothetical protein